MALFAASWPPNLAPYGLNGAVSLLEAFQLLPHVSIAGIRIQRITHATIIQQVVAVRHITRIREDLVEVTHIVEVVACTGGSQVTPI